MAGAEELDEDERVSVNFMLLANMRIFETLYYQYKNGTLDKKLFDAELKTLKWAVTDARAFWRGGPSTRSRSAPSSAPSSTASFVRRRSETDARP